MFQKAPVTLAATVFKWCALLLALAASPVAGQEKDRRDVPSLPVGQTFERQLGEGEVHFYKVKLKKGESLRLDLTEKGIDCALAVVSKQVLGVNFGDGFERETITYVARDKGTCTVVVSGPPVDEFTAIARIAVGDKSHTGSYSLTASINRAGQAEKQREQAVQSLTEALQLHLNGARGDRVVIQKLEGSLRLWQELKEDYWAAHTATHLAILYYEAGWPQKAVEHLEMALGLFRRAGDKHGQMTVNSNLGSYYEALERHAEAIKFYTEALAQDDGSGDKARRAELLNSVGVGYATLGATQTAIGYYENALLILKDFKDLPLEASVLAGVGVLYARTGETDEALSSLSRALTLAKQTEDKDLQARVLDDLGDFYSQLGQFRQALEYGGQSLRLYRMSGNRRGQAKVYANLGEFYLALGELREAQANSQKAVAIYKDIRDDSRAANALSTLSDVYEAAGEIQKASQSLHEARELLKGKESENPQLHAAILIEEGHEYGHMGDDKAAASAYEEALRVSRTISYQNSEAAALFGLARLQLRRGDYQAATTINTQALIAAASYNDPEMEARALTSLMEAWGMRANVPLAIFYGKEAVNKYQGLRTHIRGLDGATQKSFVQKCLTAYIGLAYLLYHEGRYAEALQAINSFRDQQFYDFGLDANAPARRLALTPREAAFSTTHAQIGEQVVTLNRRLAELKRRVGEHPSPEQADEIARLAESFDKQGKEFDRAILKAAADFSQAPRADQAGATVEDLKEMQSILRELNVATGQKTAAIYTLDGGGIVVVLLITPDAVSAAAVVVKGDFNEKVLQYYAVLQTPALDPRRLGKELYDIVVKPLEPALRASGAQTLLWSLGGTLRYVPMAALWDGERYLVERFRHVVFTRADRERMTRAAGREWTGFGFGGSREHSIDLLGDGNRVSFAGLPGVAEELRAIFRPAGREGVVRGEVFIDGAFTKAAFLEIARRHPALVHVASHFSFRPGDDSQSFLLLGDGTTLTLNEMKRQGRLFEGVELLTLSACETAATRADAMGREIDGFADASQRLGAGAVLATLWTVADDSTPMLMREFYRARQGGAPVTKAEALRMAQLTLLKGRLGGAARLAARASVPSHFKVELVDKLDGDEKHTFRSHVPGADIVYIERAQAPPFNPDRERPYAHPYYWAPFVLIGNGR
jgi:CHAT domain-containing protein/uncharacterized protein HemY